MTDNEAALEKRVLKEHIEMLSALTLYLVQDNPIIENHPLWSNKVTEIRALLLDLKQHL